MARQGWRLGRCLRGPGGSLGRPQGGCRGLAQAAAAATVSRSEDRLKRPEELPGPGPLKSHYLLFARGYLLHTHRLQVLSKKMYGPMWKSWFGSNVNVNIGSAETLEEVVRQEGKYPIRSDMALWKEHRDKRHLPYGPFTEDGERWHRLRQVLNKRMLKPSEAVLYADVINEVVSDLMIHLENERNKSPSGVMITDIANVLYRFALEGKKLIDQRMVELEKHLERGEEVSGYLTYLLSSGRLSPEEVYGSIAELLLAGVDTTSNTLSWALYHLAKNPDIQEALYQEVTSVVSKDKIPNAKDLARMPLLKAIVKETLRLYPVVPTNARIIAENDVVVGGYHFPKDTLFVLAHYAISHDESNFPEPERFIPSRWLRDQRDSSPHPFSSIPFGYGVRACAGRRIAELEMHLALARLVRTFLFKPDPQQTEVKPLARIVLVPDKPINLEFLDRQTMHG
ncbi:sterol 26-hydroxylase, mitochondrial isoform X2 [Anolis carolinensis]|uniref:sterol 26-hydroxylase, mitochondrial isoform X2 n=1 Tax=Anolis carolinensis TaxID=28377 RepID=UPI002F2B1543